MDMKQVVKYTMTKVFKISPDEDAKKTGISKTLTAKVEFDNPLIDIVHKAGAGAIIQWQNGNSTGRKKYDTYTNNQVITIKFSAPSAAATIDPETAMVAKLQSMSPEEQQAYIESMLKKAN